MTMPLGILLASKLWTWLRHLGGPGLLLLGLADNSIIPMPGSMDVLTIWFAVHHHNQWIYYAVMATVGSVIGGYATYRLARKGGEQVLERRMGGPRTVSFCQKFRHWVCDTECWPTLGWSTDGISFGSSTGTPSPRSTRWWRCRSSPESWPW